VLFTSCTFLFLFLPVVLAFYFVAKSVWLRNVILLLASLLFYAWGEPAYVLIMLGTIVFNYFAAMAVEDTRSSFKKKQVLALSVVANLFTLSWFKYADFIVQNINYVISASHHKVLPLPHVHLPLGISFFIFHSLSYVIDIYRGVAQAQRNPLNMGLYIALFPQLVAGPIIRYHDICNQLVTRTCNVDLFGTGARRFIIGLGKKMLIANTLAIPADKIFAIPAHDLTSGLTWLGIVCYTLQIYFDFSGYSDMAIGLGLMFGFHFLENFNYPYIAQSIREFWQRWHISLSNWFKDYLYIPLGGNRKSSMRTCLNLLTVFLLCGLWHGASWNFIAWGAFHGSFLGMERLGLGNILTRLPQVIRHIYTLLAVMIGWVFFRANDLTHALGYIKAMVGLGHGNGILYHPALYLNTEVSFVLLIGIIGSAPVLYQWLNPMVARISSRSDSNKQLVLSHASSLLRVSWVFAVFALSICEIAAGTYNPFIYFRF
jgi:alginate O-acetyltransferase complex protein AlgI